MFPNAAKEFPGPEQAGSSNSLLGLIAIGDQVLKGYLCRHPYGQMA